MTSPIASITKFVRNGTAFSITDNLSLDIHDKLPPGNYVIKINPINDSLYFDQIDSFTVTKKVYGDIAKLANRILNTFEDRDVSTGVLLAGLKGSGKTLLSKLLSIKCSELGYPTIVVNSPYAGDDFNLLIQSLQQPCLVLFDEFEKVYSDHKEQAKILTLFDGVFPSKKFFVITCNEAERLNVNLLNRPGRMFYAKNFTGMSLEAVREYCEDCLKDKNHIDSICKLTFLFEQFNFDMLQALVQEMNRYNETPHEALTLLNVKPELTNTKYEILLKIDGVQLSENQMTDDWYGNPLLKQTFHIDYFKDIADSDADADYVSIYFSIKDLKKVDDIDGSMLYVDQAGNSAKFTKAKPTLSYNGYVF